jgi:hypothetical protein
MNRARRTRLQPKLEAEFLESRHLLTASVAHHTTAHVEKVTPKAHAAAAPKPPAPPKAPSTISGTLTGVSPYTTNPGNTNQGNDTYALSAPTPNGVATYSGTDAFTGTQVSASTIKDTYFAGFTVLYLAGGNQVSISYAGNGTYPTASSGPYSVAFKGEAVGIEGAVTGHEYSFNATLYGNAANDDVTLKFSLKS